MSDATARVFLIDDDAGVRKALSRLLRAAKFDVAAFPSPQAFLQQHDAATPGCLLLDIAMPGLNGLELQRALAAAGCERPIVFITGQGDVPTSVQAMKAGAVDFLTKPVTAADLLAAISSALARDHAARRRQADAEAVHRRIATLTRREHQVMERVVAGLLNKQIAADLGTAEKTVKVHRARMMAKMSARSVAELVRIAQQAGPAREAGGAG